MRPRVEGSESISARRSRGSCEKPKCVTWRPESRCSYGGDTRMRQIVLSILAAGNGLDRPRRGTLAHPWGCPVRQATCPNVSPGSR